MSTGEARELENKKVMYMETTSIPAGIAGTFHDLESKLPTLRQRKFYGVMFANKYWAAVELTSEDSPQALGLNVGEIPGGLYACVKIKEWKPESLSTEIPKTFNELVDGRRVDSSRPFIEFYRSQRELILQAPVLVQ